MAIVHSQHDTATPDFHEMVAAVLADLPARFIETIEKCRIEVVSAGHILDARADLYGKVDRLEELSGLYDRERRQIILPQFISDGEDEDLAYFTEGVLRHELGHAFDHCLANLSLMPQIRGLYMLGEDRAAARGATGKLGYYLQPGADGMREAFAEAIGVALGGGAEPLHAAVFAECFEALIERARRLVL